ncbi:radical SAM protein [Ruminococcaceae bacterium OttesenSCG-928-A11]|nr:radical SAM protein [Ruminococcaceae bacterium OttesenSCG-928-A11]
MSKKKFNLEVDESAFGLHPPVPECTGEKPDCLNCDYDVKSKASMRRLQIDLNLICNMGCENCDRHLDIAPGSSEHDISLEQISRMLSESVDVGYEWEAILLLGGEPTLHPQFRDIVHMIVEYKNKNNTALKIRMASNGYSELTRKELQWVRDTYPFVVVVDTAKTSKEQADFVNIRRAPKDRYPEQNHFERCNIPCYSGIGFNYSGFYGCATGGATAKLFGFDIGIKRVKDLTYGNLENFYKSICPLCGHYDAAQILREKDLSSVSSSWANAIDLYKKEGETVLTRY